MEQIGSTIWMRADSDIHRLAQLRQRTVAALIVAGHTNKAMAQTLNVAVRTIEVHCVHIMDKMQAAHLP